MKVKMASGILGTCSLIHFLTLSLNASALTSPLSSVGNRFHILAVLYRKPDLVNVSLHFIVIVLSCLEGNA